ncbi:hypothetical protein LTR95_006534, partial [Oleoguttula sp. CCFEE 5521]
VSVNAGTGSARACITNEEGDIVGLASQNIGLWQPETVYYEQSITEIWKFIHKSVHRVMDKHNISPDSAHGICFDVTRSLADFDEETGEPRSVTGPKSRNADANDNNVILRRDHRSVEESKKINATKHNLLKYVGGTMSMEIEMPKIL